MAVVPIRSFGGFSRLASHLDPTERSRLGRALASGVLQATTTADLPTFVVTDDEEVAHTAVGLGVTVISDPGRGLDGAASTGVATATGEREGVPWLVLHADLPLVTAAAVARAAEAATRSTVLVPSPDGGTTVIGGTVGDAPSVRFSFGRSSFHRHLAQRPDAVILTDPRLSVDLDTPIQLAALRPHVTSA